MGFRFLWCSSLHLGCETFAKFVCLGEKKNSSTSLWGSQTHYPEPEVSSLYFHLWVQIAEIKVLEAESYLFCKIKPAKEI